MQYLQIVLTIIEIVKIVECAPKSKLKTWEVLPKAVS